MEEWTRWQPTQGLSGKYYLESLTWSEQGVIILLSDESNSQKIEIIFKDFVDAYRCTNESFYFLLFSDLSKQYGTDFYKDWSFFKVQNSKYIQWLSIKSATWADQFSFIHFSIFGGNEIIDIVARYEPTVSISPGKHSLL